MADESLTPFRIELDISKCSGLGLCEAASPAHFEVQDDGSLLILRAGVNADEEGVARAAVRACPTEALRLVQR